MAHQLSCPGGRDEAAALGLVRSQHGRETARRQILPELGPRAAVALAGALDAGRQMVSRKRRERDRMADEYSVQAIVRRDHVEEPAHGALLEAGTAWRVNAVWPSRRDITCHDSSLGWFEQDFYIAVLP